LEIKSIEDLWMYLLEKYDKVFHILSFYSEEELITDKYQHYNHQQEDMISNEISISHSYERPVIHDDFDSTDQERQEEIVQYIKNIQNNNKKSKLLSAIDDLDERTLMVKKINESMMERHPNRLYNKKKMLHMSKVKLEPLNQCMSSIQHYDIYGPVLLIHHLQKSIKNDPIVESKQFLIHANARSFEQIFKGKQRAYFNMSEKVGQSMEDTIHKLLFYYYVVYKGDGKSFYIWFITYFRPQWSEYVREKHKYEMLTNFPSWIEGQRDEMKKNMSSIMRQHRWNMVYDSVRLISLSICSIAVFLLIIIPLINKFF